jgi:hypothetical protein
MPVGERCRAAGAWASRGDGGAPPVGVLGSRLREMDARSAVGYAADGTVCRYACSAGHGPNAYA